MNKNEAIKKIVSNYLLSTGISQSDFARRGGLTRDYVNKLIKREPSNKYGISFIMFSKIAQAMAIQVQDLENMILAYDKNNSISQDFIESSKTRNNIIDLLKNSNFNEKQLLEIYSFIKNLDSKNN